MYPATAYSGLSPRRLWQALASGELARIRVPGSRRTLVDATDLDRWLEGFKDVPAEARRPGLEGA